MAAATRVVTNSCFMRESLYRVYGIAPAVSYHGVDAERFRPLGLDRAEFVLSVGMLTPAKGFDFVIRSLGLIDSSWRPHLIIVSNFRLEEEARYLESLAGEFGVALEFRTMVSDEELVRLYNLALCTVYAPVLESFGLVPLESMACGTPVVGIREGGVRETVVDGITGLLADRDEGEFAQAVATLVDDSSLRERYGRQGREHVAERWTWDRSVASLERHLTRVAQSGR
jgi:glycosyltransferase involved in cell wall biosynthesis